MNEPAEFASDLPASGAEGGISLGQFEFLARKRRATRHFTQDAVDRELIERLLGVAQWAPSGFNLQPTRFVLVTDRSIRPALRRACLDQPQVEEAPAVVVFAGDHRAYEDYFEEVLALDLAGGAIDANYAARLRKVVPLMFERGPAHVHWLWKAAIIPLARIFFPLPSVVLVDKRFWLAKQVALCAMNFMLAAEAAGLNTLPMEGFDTGRLRRVLDLPKSWEPMLVMPVGYGQPRRITKTRLPLNRVVLRR